MILRSQYSKILLLKITFVLLSLTQLSCIKQTLIYAQAQEASYTDVAITKYFEEKKKLIANSLPPKIIFSGNLEVGGTPEDTFNTAFSKNLECCRVFVALANSNVPGKLISGTIRAIKTYSVSLIGFIEIPIHLNIIRRKDDSSQLKEVVSYNPALMEAKTWLEYHNVKTTNNGSSTAKAASSLSKGDLSNGTGVIASSMAIEKYSGLVITHHNVEDESNYTVFAELLILGKHTSLKTDQEAEETLWGLIKEITRKTALIGNFTNVDKNPVTVQKH